MAHRHRHFPANLERAVQKQVEAAIDRALARVFDRHHAEIDYTGFGLAKDFVDAHAGHRIDAMTELGDHRLLGEGASRPEISHPQLALEFATGRDHLAPDRGKSALRQRPGVALFESPQDLRLTLGPPDRRLLGMLECAYLQNQSAALGQERKKSLIDVVNLLPECIEPFAHHQPRRCSKSRMNATRARTPSIGMAL